MPITFCPDKKNKPMLKPQKIETDFSEVLKVIKDLISGVVKKRIK